MCFTSPCWLNRLSVNWVCSGSTIHAGNDWRTNSITEAKAALEVRAPPVMAWTWAQSTMGRTKGNSPARRAMSPSVPKERSLPPVSSPRPTPRWSILGATYSSRVADPLDQLIGGPVVGVAEVGADHRRPHGSSQLHRVLQGGKALFRPVLLLDGEDREVGGVQREPYVPLRRQGPEAGTTLLLPGEAGDEGKLQGAMPLAASSSRNASSSVPSGVTRDIPKRMRPSPFVT